MYQVERAWLRRRVPDDVVPAHLVPAVRVQPGRIDVRGEHVTGWSDGRGQCLGNAGAAGAAFPAAPARLHSEPVEVPPCDTVEQLGQPGEPLARLHPGVVEQIAVIGAGPAGV